MIKALKVLPFIFGALSLYFIVTSAMRFSTDTITFGQALLTIIMWGIMLYISYGAYKEIRTLEKRISRQTKCAVEKSLSNYTPDRVNYASSFRVGNPVVTTDEYYDGRGYHAFIEDIDRSDIGRPFKIRMCGNLGFDWVSSDEIAPDKEIIGGR